MKKSEKTSVQAMLNRAREFHPIIDKIEVTPDRQIHPGDSVHIGCLKNIEVLETFDDGRWILVEYDTLNHDRDEKSKDRNEHKTSFRGRKSIKSGRKQWISLPTL